MRIAPVAAKELRSYFNSPIAYIVVIAFLVFTSIWFFYLNHFFALNEASMRVWFGVVPTVFIFLIPAITMRSWAEERKAGTLEILMTLPFRESEVVLGKFLGALGLLLILLMLTLPLPLSLAPLGEFDAGQIFGEYMGVLLIGASGISVGLLVSSLSTNQITAFILSGLALLFFTLIGQINSVAQLPRWLGSVTNWISFGAHYDGFRKGLLDSRDLIYFLLVIGLSLAWNTWILIQRKWK
jgi:ABC-2 type transport system permease protein